VVRIAVRTENAVSADLLRALNMDTELQNIYDRTLAMNGLMTANPRVAM
jgi:hypothetical protein